MSEPPGALRIVLGAQPDTGSRARRDALVARFGFRPARREDLPDDEPVLVVHRDRLVLRLGGVDRAWHPGMLHTLREAGAQHPLVRLSGVTRGHTVVDCTLGLGTDATFLAEWTGTRVTGLEVVPALAAMAMEGLAATQADVEVVHAEAVAWLRHQPDHSVDLVVADPMFPGSPDGTSLDAVRWVARQTPLGPAWRDEALRVARLAVVVRDREGGRLLEALQAPIVHGRAGRKARYGAWRTTG